MTAGDVALIFAARAILAAVFAVAGTAKLADLSGSRRALSDFGVPASLTAPLGLALPVVELALAFAFLFQPLVFLAALGSVVLLVVFIAAIGRNLAQGRRAECHCFGQVHSEPAGWDTIARNAALAIVAGGLAIAVRSESAPDPFVWFRSSTLAAAMLAAGAIAFWWWLRTRPSRTNTSEATGAESGALDTSTITGGPAPSFSLPDVDGHRVTLDALSARGVPVLLFFSDPTCGPCTALAPDVSRWDRDHRDRFTVAVISRGTAEQHAARQRAHPVTHLLLQQDREVALAYGAPTTPAAIFVAADGTLATPVAGGGRAIHELVARTVQAGTTDAPAVSPAPRVSLVVSSLAPDFRLPSLDGAPLALSAYRGRGIVVLFWSPSCGHCQRMLRHLRAWETMPSSARQPLLVVSNGTAEANRASGLTATTVLDDAFTVGRQYGVRGTPSAVLIDAEGRVARELAVGEAAILTLLGYRAGDAIPSHAKPRRRSDVDDELLSDGSMIVYSSEHRRVLTLNGAAALIWENCDGTQSLHAIVSDVRSAFDSTAEVEADVRSLVDTLMADGLLTIDSDAPADASVHDRVNA